MNEPTDEQALLAEVGRIIDAAAVDQGITVKGAGFTMQIAPDQAEMIRRLAHMRGVSVTELVREIILGRLAQEQVAEMTEDEIRSAIARLRRKAGEQ